MDFVKAENAELRKRVEELETMLALSGKPVSNDPVVTTTDGIEPTRYVHIVCPTCAELKKRVEEHRRLLGRALGALTDQCDMWVVIDEIRAALKEKE